MKIVFRADASNYMGVGHLIRCLTLATFLRDRGMEIRFICRAHSGNLIEFLQKQAIPVSILPKPELIPADNSDDYAANLGVPQSEDAHQSIQALGGDCPGWLIVDQYGLDKEWERLLRPHVGKIMVIDDLANRPHDCDLLLDQNYYKNGEHRYDKLVPEECKLFIGPRFALLRPEYTAHRHTLRNRDGTVRRIFVFFGGADQRNITSLALDALTTPEFSHLDVDIVVGSNHLHRGELGIQVSKRPLTKLYGPRPHLADLMARADLSIGACGTTTWERMCLGLPSIVVTLADNQIPVSKFLAEKGLIRLVGYAGEVSAEDIYESLRDEIKTRQYILRSKMGMEICDGTGAIYIVDALLSIQKVLRNYISNVK